MYPWPGWQLGSLAPFQQAGNKTKEKLPSKARTVEFQHPSKTFCSVCSGPQHELSMTAHLMGPSAKLSSHRTVMKGLSLRPSLGM